MELSHGGFVGLFEVEEGNQGDCTIGYSRDIFIHQRERGREEGRGEGRRREREGEGGMKDTWVAVSEPRCLEIKEKTEVEMDSSSMNSSGTVSFLR